MLWIFLICTALFFVHPVLGIGLLVFAIMCQVGRA